MEISDETRARLIEFQKNEITEHHIYSLLAKVQRDPANRRLLEDISADEKRHYDQWKELTGADIGPDRLRIRKYCLISRLLGFTFAVRLMEHGEADAQEMYSALPPDLPSARKITEEENEHENSLLAMLDEQRLRYVGSIVLGLNDALVELTGALAGLTLALQNSRLIALTGSITGIAAAFSMAASEYLSTKTENTSQKPLLAALYTGTAYLFTVIVLILPYLLASNFWIALGCTMASAVLIIAFFNYYISVARDIPFGKRFAEMAGLSMGVAALSFLIGFVLRTVWGIEV
ncbi:MAG: VIT1/CCC1 transporter family protein [Kiritimatiellia bacterium]